MQVSSRFCSSWKIRLGVRRRIGLCIVCSITTRHFVNPDRAMSQRHSTHEKKVSAKVVEYLKASGPRSAWTSGTRRACVSPTDRKVWFAVVIRTPKTADDRQLSRDPAVSLAEARHEEARKIIRDAQLGVLENTRNGGAELGETVPLFIQLLQRNRKPRLEGRATALARLFRHAPCMKSSAATLCASWTLIASESRMAQTARFRRSKSS